MKISIEELKAFESDLKVSEVISKILEKEKLEKGRLETESIRKAECIKSLVGGCFCIKQSTYVLYIRVDNTHEIVNLVCYTTETTKRISKKILPLCLEDLVDKDYNLLEEVVEIEASEFQQLLGTFENTYVIFTGPNHQ